MDLVLDIYSDCYQDYELMDQLLISLVQMDEILIDSKWNCIDRNHIFRHATVLFHVNEITGKVLLPYVQFYCLSYTR